MATNRSKSSSAHLTLANNLAAWASENGVSDDPYVANLILDLEERKNLSMWASLNPLEYLPQAEHTNNEKLARYGSLISAFRNVLVFAPVALTWIAISKATTAFAKYISHNSTVITNFLDFWQNGYGVLPTFWRIGEVALVDFLLIVLIIVLTLVASIIEERVQRTRQKQDLIIENQRQGMALEISTYLFDKQFVTNVTMNQGLATAVRDLVKSTQILNQTTKELNKTVKAVPSNRDILVELRKIKSKFMTGF